jgi:hypothetical protein
LPTKPELLMKPSGILSKRVPARASVGLLAILVACSPAEAPKAASEANQSSLTCSDCAIALDSVAVLEDTTGDRLAEAMRIAEWDGRFLVSGVGNQGAQFSTWANSGEYIRMLGDPGEGPGQFYSIKDFALDSSLGLVVLNRQITRVSPTFETTSPIKDPDYTQAFRITPVNGGYVINSYGGKAPLLFLDDSLVIQARVGMRAMDPDSNQFVITSARGGGVWAARAAYSYDITRYDASGREVARLTPVRDWFAAWEPISDPALRDFRRSPLRPRVTAMQELENGNLQMLIITADANFVPLEGQSSGESQIDAEQFRRYVDTVIEIIDPSTGEIVASRRLDDVFGGFTPRGRIWRLDYRGDTTRAELFALTQR